VTTGLPATRGPQRIRPPIVLTAVASWLQARPNWLLRLADWETAALDDLLPPVDPRPIWVTGLVRSGSTLLIDFLAQHRDIATHRHRDYPFVVTPSWWSLAYALTPRLPARPRERAHGDGLLVTPDSPDAYEEMIWPLADLVSSERFAMLHRDHLRKIQYVRRRPRYAAKAHRHAGRIEKLRAMYPGARFVIPVRDPVQQVASAMRQHARFLDAAARNPRVARHMASAGHTEFGPGREPPSAASEEEAVAIAEAWAGGDEARGWALAWRSVYGVLRRDAGPDALWLPFEDLCLSPAASLRRVLEFAELPDDGHAERFAAMVRAPREEPVAAAERAAILDAVGDVAGPPVSGSRSGGERTVQAETG
jgi:hypothetical protein